ncbi:MarR family winged helix-turn-helix transcriptional regulator [Tsukamurella ocularis]|uniref:MarR family winged helix-turn-helix transcriptional regulator n=1 Tax=Tsukamurella ocularis TaxID=1970234 RepID=UPI0039EF2596
MTQEVDALQSRIGYRIKEAQVAIRVRMEEGLRPFDLSAAQYAALELIDRTPRISNAQLARDAFVTRQSMNTMIKSLERRGLITRATEAPSGRELPTTLTRRGTELLRAAAVTVSAMETQAVAHLSETQQRQLLSGLESVITALRPPDA